MIYPESAANMFGLVMCSVNHLIAIKQPYLAGCIQKATMYSYDRLFHIWDDGLLYDRTVEASATDGHRISSAVLVYRFSTAEILSQISKISKTEKLLLDKVAKLSVSCAPTHAN